MSFGIYVFVANINTV